MVSVAGAAQRRGRGPGLRGKLILALLGVALVPLGVVTGVLAGLKSAELEDAIRDHALALSGEAGARARSVVDWGDNELLGAGAALADPSATLDQRLRTARARLLAGRHVRSVAVYDAAGALVDTITDKDRAPPAHRPDTLNEALREQASEAPVVRLPVQLGADGTVYLPLLATMHRSRDRVFGYVWTELDLGLVSAAMDRLVTRDVGVHGLRQAYVLDGEGRVVAHPDPKELGRSLRELGLGQDLEAPAAALKSGTAYVASFERGEQSVLAVLQPIPELGWGVVLEHDADIAYQAVRTLGWLALLLGLGAGLVALVVGLVVGQRLSAPVLAVAEAARRVAEGEFSVRVGAVGADEVAEMAGAFDHMAASLQSYERRVVEETRIRTNLSRYLSTEVVEQVVADERPLRLGGERRVVTVLFADVVAFTELAQTHPPERTVATLNELFTFLTEIVFRHGGIVDKFLGDCVMAVFGAPYDLADHELAAARAADEMLRWVQRGNSRWRKKLGRSIELSVGVATGEVLAGNLGSEKRMEYTVIGDAVNLAARLEHLARADQVLLEGRTADAVAEEYDCESLGLHTLGGRAERVEIFELQP